MTLRRARIAAFAVAVPALMRLPLPRLERLLGVVPRGSARSVDAVAADVEVVLSHPTRLIRRGCLTRGLTRYFFLRRAGADVVLCFGMGHVESNLEGHCWIELDGQPVRESRDPRPVFAVTYRFA